MKPYRLVQTLMLLLLSSIGIIASADEEIINTSYTSFGIGIQAFHYTEDLSGSTFNVSSSSTPISIVQYSGGYTALNDTDGFYITTTSPLFSLSSVEEWQTSSSVSTPVVDFPDVQTNQTELGLSQLSISLSRIFTPGHQGLVGIKYSAHYFTRYNFAPGEDAQAFNEWLINDPAYTGGATAFFIPGCTTDTSPPVLGMECSSVAIQEQVSTLSLSTGYKFDTFFIKDYKGPRFIFATHIATPLFYAITNTLHPGSRLMGTFGGGYDLSINTSVAIIDRKDFQINIGMETAIMHRKQVTLTGTNLSYPNSNTLSASLYMSFDWSFD